ncbi:hypothetical protein QTP86_015175, partial [Hemibagrus guttatus]
WMRRKKREWEAEMKSNIATGSLPPLQVRLCIAGKGGSAPRPARTQIVFASDIDEDKGGVCDETDSTGVKTVMFSCSHSA